MAPVLVTGATGRVGRVLIDHLLSADVPVRALHAPTGGGRIAGGCRGRLGRPHCA